jgi:hypothetical protein
MPTDPNYKCKAVSNLCAQQVKVLSPRGILRAFPPNENGRVGQEWENHYYPTPVRPSMFGNFPKTRQHHLRPQTWTQALPAIEAGD